MILEIIREHTKGMVDVVTGVKLEILRPMGVGASSALEASASGVLECTHEGLHDRAGRVRARYSYGGLRDGAGHVHAR